jgi:hypothetical protein
MSEVPASEVRERHVNGEDWYAEDLAGARYVECTSADVDPTG